MQATVQKDTILRPSDAVLLDAAVVVAIVIGNELPCFIVQGKEHFRVAHGIAVLLSVMSQRNVVVLVCSVEGVLLNRRLQADHTTFANQWLRNIATQQHLL